MIVAIDSHMHGDILLKQNRDFPARYRDNSIGGIIWSYNENIHNASDYTIYWNYLKNIAEELSEKNSPFFYKIGIHPRTICQELKNTKKLTTELKRALETHMKNPKCLGIGEIGLDGEDEIQEKIFIEQLNWCINYLPENKRIGIHTPRKNKYKITQKILDILNNYKSLHKQIVIDHVELNTIELVKKINVQIGITLQEGKSTKDDVEKLVNNNLYDINKVMLNSDSGKIISRPYIDFVTGKYLRSEEKAKLLKHNIISFYNLEEHLS
ncbi:TatD family hydrolase [Desulfothermus sp.]